MIQVAIIGAGSVSHAHIQAYLQFPTRVRIASLVDMIPGKAEKVKDQYGLNCECLLDYFDILDREDIDLVDCCCPPYRHADISINALRAGKHVICEKPMAISLEECDAMIHARDESGKKLSIISQNRFSRPIRDLKALLDSGIAGPVRCFQADSFWWRGRCYYDLWWRGTWEKEGGGCTINHAVHHIDILGWMMGLPGCVTSVLANTGHDNADVEDLSVSILEYPGALGLLAASVLHHGEEQQLVFQCEKAKLAVPFSVFASVSKDNGFPVRDEVLETEMKSFVDALPPLPNSGIPGQIDNVLMAIETDILPAVSGEDGRLALEVITAIYKSGSLRQPVFLPLSQNDPFYTSMGIRANVLHFKERFQP